MVNIHVDLTWLMYVADSPLQHLQDRTASRQSQSGKRAPCSGAVSDSLHTSDFTPRPTSLSFK